MSPTVRLLPLAALLAGCTAATPGYRYGPASYATPPYGYGQPVAPLPAPVPAFGQPVPPQAMITTNPLPPPGTFLPDRQPAPPPVDDTIEQPPVRDPSPPPPEAQAAPSADPVADILLAPPPSAASRTPAPGTLPEAAAPDPAAASVSKRPTDSNPMMGFRPMRGQTAPSY